MKRYIIDRTDYSGYKTETATADDLRRIYAEEVSRTEYPDFSGWFEDMMKAALIMVDSCAGYKYKGVMCECQCDEYYD